MSANLSVSIASSSGWRHDRQMGSELGDSIIPDLFSKVTPQEKTSPSPKLPIASAIPTSTASRHVLPSDLPAAIRHLDDHELEQLQCAVRAEQQRRGKILPTLEMIVSKQPVEGIALTPGKLNAVRAAFKAGVTASRIAKQFGIPQAEVRKVIASESLKLQERL